MLRIIALVEADWNTALKIIFRKLIRNAETVGLNELLSSTVLDAHAMMYNGLELSPATPGPGIRK
jgi:hypothetical protein